jgi:hypothetical protein
VRPLDDVVQPLLDAHVMKGTPVKVRLGLSFAAVLAAGLLVSAAGAAPAGAAAAQREHVAAAGQGQHCNVMLDRVTRGRPEMKETSRVCAAPGQPAPAVSKALADTALATVFADANYLGGSLTYYDTHGNGTCDASGYSLDDISRDNAWLNGISSLRDYDRCTAAVIYTVPYLQGYPCLSQAPPADGGPLPYVGDGCNDQVRSLHLWDRN